MRFRKRTSELFEGDLTPMIDMTFQLIAFFMVLVNFTESEQDERIKLPSSELAKPPEHAIADPIFLQLTSKGDVIIGGQVVALDGLRPYLIREGDALEKNNKTRADATIIIRADAKARTGVVQKLIQVCQDARFEKFALRAMEETQP